MFSHALHVAGLARRSESYRSRRAETLNFETVGGDVGLDGHVAAVSSPPVVRSRRFVVVTQAEEREVSKGEKKSREVSVPTFRHQRDEHFEVSGALSVHVSTRSGDVLVLAGETQDVMVRLGTDRSSESDSLARVQVELDAARGTLVIETSPKAQRGLRGLSLSDWFDRAGDADVVLVLPKGSDLQVTTVSGDTRLNVALGDVEVSSVSGDVRALDALESLDVRTASGDVTAGMVRERLRCRVASGDVRVANAAARTDVASASGDVSVTAMVPSDVAVNSASGDVRVKVLEGLLIDVTGRTVSGRLESKIDLNGQGDGGGDDQVSAIRVTTVSGDILIDRVRA